MIFLALALMALIVITQLFTNQSTRKLNQGNQEAVETFRLSNSNREVVNLSQGLFSKLSKTDVPVDSIRSARLSDSVIILGFKANNLSEAIAKSGHPHLADELNQLVSRQIELSHQILVALNSGNKSRQALFADSLTNSRVDVQINSKCLEVQRQLEINLEETLDSNSILVGRLSNYSRILAIVAIIAIVIMANIIIKRQFQQQKLIENLKEAEMVARRSKNAKEEFLANMSHELRTPLNSLVGFGNLLKDTPLNPQQQEFVSIINSSSFNLLNIVNDVLDLSKIEAGKLRITREPFQLSVLLRKLEFLFSEALMEKNLRYDWEVEKDIPETLIGDSNRLEQILVNLLGNAIKFTNHGMVSLNVGIVWQDEENKCFKLGFTMKDTGVGIPASKVPVIFERFEQLEGTATRSHGGAGLGLTIVKSLVENMGGTISVFSEVGAGSEFHFTCVFDRADARPIADIDTGSISTGATLSDLRVLLVEDNKANQVLLKHILNKFNLNLAFAENGLLALQILEKQPFDLILMDIQMPEMDGYTAIGKLRGEMKLQTPVIAMTAYVSENVVEKCLRAGFNDYLAKPIEEHLLVEKLSKYAVMQLPLPVGSDLGYLNNLLGGDQNAIQEILTEMKTQWEIDRADFKIAVSAGDIKEIKRIFHRMKSTFSPLGPDHKIYELIQMSSRKVSGEADEGAALAESREMIDQINTSINPILKEHLV